MSKFLLQTLTVVLYDVQYDDLSTFLADDSLAPTA